MGPRLTLIIPQAEKDITNKETKSNRGKVCTGEMYFCTGGAVCISLHDMYIDTDI